MANAILRKRLLVGLPLYGYSPSTALTWWDTKAKLAPSPMTWWDIAGRAAVRAYAVDDALAAEELP